MHKREVEFAGCLLEIGGPPVAFYHKDDRPVSTTGYMFAASHWYKRNIEKPITRDSADLNIEFHTWWTNYKQWIEENHRG